MHLLFVDESGTPPKPGKVDARYFVVGVELVSPLPSTILNYTHSPLASLPAAVRLTPEVRWSRSFPRLPPRSF